VGAQDREVSFVCGSLCRVLSGQIPLPDGKTTVQDLWHWSVQTTRDLKGTAVDVPPCSPPP
jgi:hypothetical protein